MNNIDFACNLVKGKIAETIFAQMFRETNQYTVLEFGYEKVIPELIQRGYEETNPTIETIKTAPDFAVINQNTKKVSLIEVKYKHTLNPGYVLKDAIRMGESWNPSYLFVATLDGFFFDDIDKIIKNNGNISKLKTAVISEEIQKQYLQILVRFENGR